MASDAGASDTSVYFMKQALLVARAALEKGEVPVGCVIVLRDGVDELKLTGSPDLDSTPALSREHQVDEDEFYLSSRSVIISHGANQVNATRDATRHAEVVAIDRMLTQGRSSDLLKLPTDVICKSAHGIVPDGYSSNGDDDHWINIPSRNDHWKNDFGWGSGRVYNKAILSKCDLYVTCEPCIMVSYI
jgi:tRNA(Arg) A34 adenosine deaminase TadA